MSVRDLYLIVAIGCEHMYVLCLTEFWQKTNVVAQALIYRHFNEERVKVKTNTCCKDRWQPSVVTQQTKKLGKAMLARAR